MVPVDPCDLGGDLAQLQLRGDLGGREREQRGQSRGGVAVIVPLDDPAA
ncbi:MULTISPECIES: hypothetical protein [unclassified Arthrobacter]